MMAILSGVAAVLSGIGLAEALAVSRLVVSFARTRPEPPTERPPVTILKPLHGTDPLLEEALTTLCRQDYPVWQIVFGVQDAADPAIEVVNRLRQRFPAVDIALVVDPALHGRNRKVGNLINMMHAVRHEVLVIADADVHVLPDYLDRLVSGLLRPRVGLVTTLYAGLPVLGTGPANDRRASFALPAKLGATHITHGFLPAAVLARALGRQDCLGATMCLRRSDLDAAGGFHALADHLADDNVLGRRIVALGLRVVLATTVPLTTVPETSFKALFRHELRWARTIRALEPAGFAASAVQYPLAWALLTVMLTGAAPWSLGLFSVAWVLRAVAARSVDRALATLWTRDSHPATGQAAHDAAGLAFSCPVWLLPLRDVLSVTVMIASYAGRRVDWRGHDLHADTPLPFAKPTMTLRRIERSNAL